MRKEIFFILAILSLVFIIGFINFAGDKVILVNRFDYQPEDIVIKKGSSVYWFNVDLEGHNVTTDTGKNKENNSILNIDLYYNSGVVYQNIFTDNFKKSQINMGNLNSLNDQN